MNFIDTGDRLMLNNGCVVIVVKTFPYYVVDENGVYYSKVNGRANKDSVVLSKSQWASHILTNDMGPRVGDDEGPAFDGEPIIDYLDIRGI